MQPDRQLEPSLGKKWLYACNFTEDRGVWAKVVAGGGFLVKPVIAQAGSRAFPAAAPYSVYVFIQHLIRIFGRLPVYSATLHHAPQTAFRGKRIAPVENGKNEADDYSQVDSNGEVGIDEVHDLTLLRTSEAKLLLEYTTT